MSRRPFRIVLFLAAAALLIAGLPPPPDSLAQGTGGTVLEDPDYRFRIESPGPGCRLLPEAEARRLLPDAIAGMTDLRGTFYFVIVEEAPGTSLDSYVRLLKDSMSLEGATFGEVESLTWQGLPARRWTSEGRIRDLDVRYRHLVFARGPFHYQVIGHSLRSAPIQSGDPPDLDLLARCLVLTDGEIRARQIPRATGDMAGVGWRVRDGVYHDAANGLAIAPPPGWRLALGEELRTMNDSACVGLVSSDPEAFAVMIVERARGVDPDAFLARLRDGVGASGTVAGPPAKVAVGGREFEFRRLRLATPMPLLLHHAARWDDGRAVQVLWWCVEGLADRARPRVAEALAAVRFLDAPRTEALARELLAAGDPQDRVGPAFCLRGGTYRDFEHGFAWAKPPGFWVVTTGQEARARNADATIYVEEASAGLQGMVIAEADPGLDPAEFHRFLVDRLEPVDDPPEPRTVALGGAGALVSEVEPGVIDLPMRYVVASVVHGGRAFQLLLWGLPGNVEAARPGLAAAIRALTFPARQVAEERVDGAWVDHRLGFRLRRPRGDGWRLTRITPEAIRPAANLVLFESGSGAVLGGGICAMTEEQDERFFRDILMQLVRSRAGEMLGETAESEATVAGRPARRLEISGPRPMVAWFLQRGRTFYLLLAGSAPGADFRPEEAPALLELLD